MASIFIAVGHGVSTDGSWDCGCVDGNYTEAGLMSAIAEYVCASLDASGVTVHSDFYGGNDRNMTYTVRDANALGVDAYVSLHCDYNQAPSGTYPIIYPGSSSGMALANAINSAVMSQTGIGTRGVLQRDDYEVSGTNMPACIFECGSIRQDIELLDDYHEIFGNAIGKGICDYFGVAFKGSLAKVGGGSVGKSSGSVAPTSSSASSASSSDDLWDDIYIQYFLNIFNYGCPDIDGDYGSDTARCVKLAQADFGIEQDGVWGAITQSHAESKTLSLQKTLCAKGYSVDCDGIAGPQTFQAVKQFQSANGLEVDGIVGPLTSAKLG